MQQLPPQRKSSSGVGLIVAGLAVGTGLTIALSRLWANKAGPAATESPAYQTAYNAAMSAKPEDYDDMVSGVEIYAVGLSDVGSGAASRAAEFPDGEARQYYEAGYAEGRSLNPEQAAVRLRATRDAIRGARAGFASQGIQDLADASAKARRS